MLELLMELKLFFDYIGWEELKEDKDLSGVVATFYGTTKANHELGLQQFHRLYKKYEEQLQRCNYILDKHVDNNI